MLNSHDLLRRPSPGVTAGGPFAARAATVRPGAPVTRLVIEVGRDDEGRLSGIVRSEGLDPSSFDGVIELLARIEDLVDRGEADGSGSAGRR
jgi:hypothetical protein